MDKFTPIKIAGAALAALLTLTGLNTLVESSYPRGPLLDEQARQAGELKIASAWRTAGAAQVPAAPMAPAAAPVAASGPEKPIATLLATAKPDIGRAIAKRCAACHSFRKNGKIVTGPVLYGVTGRSTGSFAGFSYSTALKSHGGAWTVELLNCYLKSPAACIPNNKMGFSGLPNAEDRAAVIAFLRTLSEEPAPLPAK